MTFREWMAQSDLLSKPELGSLNWLTCEAVWDAALDRAARICEVDYAGHFDRVMGAHECAEAIRALKNQ